MKKNENPQTLSGYISRQTISKKITFSLIRFLFYENGDKVCSAALTSLFTRGPHHASHKYRLKINEPVNTSLKRAYIYQ